MIKAPAINYHRFADDVVITVSGHHTKRGWAERALQRLQEQFALLGVELNREKTGGGGHAETGGLWVSGV